MGGKRKRNRNRNRNRKARDIFRYPPQRTGFRFIVDGRKYMTLDKALSASSQKGVPIVIQMGAIYVDATTTFIKLIKAFENPSPHSLTISGADE